METIYRIQSPGKRLSIDEIKRNRKSATVGTNKSQLITASTEHDRYHLQGEEKKNKSNIDFYEFHQGVCHTVQILIVESEKRVQCLEAYYESLWRFFGIPSYTSKAVNFLMSRIEAIRMNILYQLKSSKCTASLLNKR